MKPNRVAQTFWLLVTLSALWTATLRAEYANNMPDDDDELFSSMTDLPSSGVSTWAVSEPYVNLWIFDQPLTYSTTYQKPIGFSLAWKHRNNRDISPSFGFGPGWECSWLSYISSWVIGSWADTYVPLGGRRSYSVYDQNNPTVYKEFKSSTTMEYTNTVWVLHRGDGSRDIYTLPYGGAKYFLAQQIDPQNRTNYFYYGGGPPTYLSMMVDWEGRTNLITYGTGSLSARITRVTDPYGRSVTFGYDGSARLTSITNATGLVDTFSYDAAGFITNMVTVYGTNSFKATTNSYGGVNLGGTNQVNRSIAVTKPDGSKELFIYRDQSTKLNPSSSVNLIPTSYSTNEVPNTAGLANTFDNSYQDARNTFHWNALQYSLLSAGFKSNPVFDNLTTNDYNLATLKHWMRTSGNDLKPVLSLLRAGGPDNNTLGQKTWFDYAGKSSSYLIGTNINPLFVALVLPDATSRFGYAERNHPWEKPTKLISTYSSGGSVATRTNTFTYTGDAIDLIKAIGYSGEQVVSNAVNNVHQVTTSFNALNHKTLYTYDWSSYEVDSIQWPSGCTTTNYYITGNQAVHWLYRSDDFTTGDSSYSSTSGTQLRRRNHSSSSDSGYLSLDERGLSISPAFDPLRRPTSVSYGGSSFTNQYSRLDLSTHTDALNYTSTYSYDTMGQLCQKIDQCGCSTLFGYANGTLIIVTNALSQKMTNFYDGLGRRVGVAFHDGSTNGFFYNLLGQLTKTIDAAGIAITNYYNNQGLLTIVSNAYGRVLLNEYDVYDRVTNTVDPSGLAIGTTYDLLGRVVKRTYPDSSSEGFGYSARGLTIYTNRLGKITTYEYDVLGRKITQTNANNEVIRYSYNAGGDLVQLVDGKNQTNKWSYDQFGRLTNHVDATGATVLTNGYDAMGRRTTRWTPGNGAVGFTYNASGDLLGRGNSGYAFYYEYDALHRLTNSWLASDPPVSLTNRFTYTAWGALASEDGPWDNDTITYSYTNQLRSALSLQQPSASPWTVNYGYDQAGRLSTIGDPNGAYTYSYPNPGELVNKLTLPTGASVTKVFDSLSRVKEIYLKNGAGTALNSHVYEFNSENQRTKHTRADGSYADYTYDNIGQLKSALGKESGGASRLNEQFGYLYDTANNLNQRTNNALVQTFSVDSRNRLTSATRSGTLTVAGTTSSQATTVTVNGSSATLYGDRTFAKSGVSLSDGNNTFTAIGQDSLGRADTNSVTLNLPATVNYTYDSNGHLTGDGQFAYVYHSHNNPDDQLTSITASGNRAAYLIYDGLGRLRVRREQLSGVTTNEIRYVYSGNLIIQERDMNNVPKVTYTRGPDLSGSLEGAGGIGGLLARTDNTIFSSSPLTAVAYYFADGNGNVSTLVNGHQAVVARYLYDPFGNTLSLSGPLAEANTYRFSSKEIHPASGLYYFGARWYNPNLQRWMARDPAGMIDGPNLYAFVRNGPTFLFDAWGMMLIPVSFSQDTATRYGVTYVPKAVLDDAYVATLSDDYNLFNIDSVELRAAIAAFRASQTPSLIRMWASELDAIDDFLNAVEVAQTLRSELIHGAAWGAAGGLGARFLSGAALKAWRLRQAARIEGRLAGSFFGMTEKNVLKNIPKGWKKRPADGNGWKLIDQNGNERIRFMRPSDETVVKWERMKNGYWRRQNEHGEFLDEFGEVVPESDPDFMFKTHIPYTGVD